MTIVIFFGICYIKWEERWKMGIYIDKFFLFLAGTWLLYNNVVIPVDVAYLLYFLYPFILILSRI